ncbi:MAG TPA: hypothetical protein VKU41_11195 [Polyangiaceae bacterium]|nr:hypothetical protein [Polyangiaceae bacterium]
MLRIHSTCMCLTGVFALAAAAACGPANGSGASPSTSNNDPSSTDFCGAFCARVHDCDNKQDVQTCTQSCNLDCASFLPLARSDVTSGVKSCFAQQDCATVLEPSSGLSTCIDQTLSAVAVSSEGMTFCNDLAAARTKCNSSSTDEAPCFDLVKRFGDGALQAADACTSKGCADIDACVATALPAQCGGSTPIVVVSDAGSTPVVSPPNGGSTPVVSPPGPGSPAACSGVSCFVGATWNASQVETITCDNGRGDTSTPMATQWPLEANGSGFSYTDASGCMLEFTVSGDTATLSNGPVTCQGSADGGAALTFSSGTLSSSDGHHLTGDIRGTATVGSTTCTIDLRETATR